MKKLPGQSLLDFRIYATDKHNPIPDINTAFYLSGDTNAVGLNQSANLIKESIVLV